MPASVHNSACHCAARAANRGSTSYAPACLLARVATCRPAGQRHV